MRNKNACYSQLYYNSKAKDGQICLLNSKLPCQLTMLSFNAEVLKRYKSHIPTLEIPGFLNSFPIFIAI